MTKRYFITFLALLIAVGLTNAGPMKVRIGWQVPWAVQGQLVQILKHTDILQKLNIEPIFVGRTYGPELNELALAGQVDVILTGDLPAITLVGKSSDWVFLTRLMYNRTAIYVPLNSSIRNLNDLRGKTLGIPIGAAAERTAKESLSSAGIDFQRDMTIVNIGILEHLPLVQKYKDEPKLGQIDALSGFDPTPAILEAKGLVRTIDVGKVVSVILIDKKTLIKQPQLPAALELAFTRAYDYYKSNRTQVDNWFLAEAKLDDPGHLACDIAASLEPNLLDGHTSDLSFTSSDLTSLQAAAEFQSAKSGAKIVIADHLLEN